MGREIKFKAWDKNTGSWYMDGDAFDLNFSGRYGDFFFDNDHPQDMREADLIWVQYTGLKDKDGAEIYEGDVIEGVLTEWSLPTMGVIEYSEEYGAWVNKNDGGKTLVFKISQFKVLGNIYEHSHLLNPKVGA